MSSRPVLPISRLSFLLLFALIPLSGCGGVATHPVEGKVVFEDGTAATELGGYQISFESADGKTSASAVVQPDGSFTVDTFEPGDGMIAGKHRVAITPPIPEADAPIPRPKIHDRYGSFENSGLEVDIESGTNVEELKVQRLKN